MSNSRHRPARRVTVYAASSRALAADYFSAASELGRRLAEQGMPICYGGGGAGLMGALANAALEAGGQVHGVIPDFLQEIEAGHDRLTSLEVVSDMRVRKARMLEDSRGVIALPGGCGTFEELFEAITLKRLGFFFGPIILINTRGYYSRLMDFLDHSVAEHFMSKGHAQMWQCVATPDKAVALLDSS